MIYKDYIEQTFSKIVFVVDCVDVHLPSLFDQKNKLKLNLQMQQINDAFERVASSIYLQDNIIDLFLMMYRYNSCTDEMEKQGVL